MTITLNGTTGIVGPNGTASAPAMTGSDTDTGIVYGTNTVQVATSGTAAVTVNSSQNVGIATSNPSKKLEVYSTSDSLQINSIVRNDQPGSGVAAIGFNVSSSAASETTSTKAGIGQVRQDSFGRGALCFYNNNTASAGDFTTSDERMRIDSSGNFQTYCVNAMKPAYDCRAWVNFNGTGTVAIRASGNVSSITDNGTADYTVNFTNAMPDTNYSIGGVVNTIDFNVGLLSSVTNATTFNATTSSVRFLVWNVDRGTFDAATVCVQIFR